MKTKTEQLVIRLSTSEKEVLKHLSKSAKIGMTGYIIKTLRLDRVLANNGKDD